MKMVHGLKMRASKLNSITFAIILFILAFIADAKTLKVDTLTPSVTDGNLLLQRNGTGEVTFGDYSGFCKFASGSPTCYANIDLTSHVTGILPIANGGTGTSSTTFVNAATNITGVLPIANGGTGSASQNFVDLTTNQSIAGDKTFSGATTFSSDATFSSTAFVTGLLTASSAVSFAEIATPSTPSSGIKVYAKSDNKLYQLTDDGTEKKLGSGGGGEAGINFIADGSFEDSTLNPDSDGGGTESYQTYTTDADLYSESNLQYFRVAYTGLSAADTYVRDSFARTALDDKQGFFSIWIKADADDFKVCVRVDDATFAAACDSALEHTIIGDSTWRKYEIPFVFGSATVQYEIYNESYTGNVNIEIDKVYVGTVPDGYIQTVGQASFVGSLTWQNSSSCVWSSTSGTEGGFGADSDCSATNILGSIQAPDTKIPAVKIPNARTDGYYRVEFLGLLEIAGAAACSYTLSSTSAYDDQGRIYVNTNQYYEGQLYGNFKFSTSGDKQVQIVVDRLSGASGADVCRVYGDPTYSAKFTVHFFPDSEANIVTQSTELPVVKGRGNGGGSITANTTAIDFTETEDNCGCWDGSKFTVPANQAGDYIFNGKVRVTTSISALKIYVNGSDDGFIGFEGASSDMVQFTAIRKLNVGDYVEIKSDTSATLSNLPLAHSIEISKQPKDATIIGKFENINSSELVYVEAQSGSGSVTAATTNVTFTEVSDTQNAWNGSEFTAPRDSTYHFSGTMLFTTNAVRFVNLYKDTGGGYANYRNCSHRSATEDIVKFECTANLNAGDKIAIREIVAGGTINPSTIYHHLTIQELPDTESIVKNLLTEQYPSARYTSNSGQTLASGNTLEFEDIVYDTHSAYNTSTGVYTIPTNASGRYLICVYFTTSSATWSYIGGKILINGVEKNEQFTRVSGTDSHSYQYCDIHNLSSADTVTIQPYMGASGTMSIVTIQNAFTISRIQ